MPNKPGRRKHGTPGMRSVVAGQHGAVKQRCLLQDKDGGAVVMKKKKKKKVQDNEFKKDEEDDDNDKKDDDKDDGCWIEQLAKRAVEADVGGGGCGNNSSEAALSKAQRIARREEKKRRQGEARVARTALRRQGKESLSLPLSLRQGEPKLLPFSPPPPPPPPPLAQLRQLQARRRQKENAARLEKLNRLLQQRVLEAQALLSRESSVARKRKGWVDKKDDDTPQENCRRCCHSKGVSLLSVETIQPRKRDYGACGLARASLWLRLQDPSLGAQLKEEFSQFVPGFYGKHHYTKALQRGKQSDMLWKRKLREKLQREQEAAGAT